MWQEDVSNIEDIPNDRDQIVDGGTEQVYFNFN
jgi:hypothetical protein